MADKISISSLMIKDHKKIEELIDILEKESKKDYESMRKAFIKFDWELEKHIFTEEKAIFSSYNPDDVTYGYKMLPELTKQHNYILNTLNNWRKEIRDKRMISDIYSFKHFIIKHKYFEEMQVYPKFDEFLPEEEKRHIIAKINEIVQK